MARSTRESILTAAAELMRHKGYGAVGMKDIAAASGAPIGSLYHHFRGGKVQIAREALINAGHAYALLIPSIVDEYTDVGDAIDGVFTQVAEDMAGTGFANMCPVASVAAEVGVLVDDRGDEQRIGVARVDKRLAYDLHLPAAEVVIQRADRRAGGLGDVLHADRAVALVPHQLRRGGQNRLPGGPCHFRLPDTD